jgi:hypothetical protein
MEWLQIVSQMGLTGVLAYIVQRLWGKCEAQQIEIAKLNELRLQDREEAAAARISDLKSMLRPDD